MEGSSGPLYSERTQYIMTNEWEGRVPSERGEKIKRGDASGRGCFRQRECCMSLGQWGSTGGYTRVRSLWGDVHLKGVI